MNSNHYDVICVVSNDLTHDQRMMRTCDMLARQGLKTLLIGRVLPESEKLEKSSYDQYRLKCLFKSGAFFYLELIIRIWLKIRKLSFSKLLCVDLDTVLIVKIISKKERSYYVDLHEYFEEVPELIGKTFKKFIWRKIGLMCVPLFDKCYTVNESLSEMFSRRYGRKFTYVRNIPIVKRVYPQRYYDTVLRTVYLGVLNPGRGIEDLINAIGPLQNVTLKIIGNGPLRSKLEKLSSKYSNIEFRGKLKRNDVDIELKEIHLGWNLLSPDSKSYYYSLGNKVFDYMLRGIPFVSMNFPEYRKLINQHPCGILIDNLKPESIRSAIQGIINCPEKWSDMHKACLDSKKDYNWQQESKKLNSIFSIYSSNSPL